MREAEEVCECVCMYIREGGREEGGREGERASACMCFCVCALILAYNVRSYVCMFSLQEERKKRLGPGGLDPLEVLETLPPVSKSL